MQPKVSVVLPVYNVEPYLSRCMEALVRQSLSDIEIIAVNDCSPDNSLAILQKYASLDGRIKVVNNETNLKLAGARNVGLAAAQGEYVSVIDSDDFIEIDFLEKLYELAKNEDADIAKGIRRDLPTNNIINNNAAVRENKWNFHFSLWTAIFRRALLQQYDIKFVVDTIVFQMRAVYFANRIATRDDALYNYCRRSDSNDSPIFSLDKWQSLNIRGADLVLDFINGVEIEESDYLLVVKSLILPLYFYGYNKLAEADKATGTEIMRYVLSEFWRRAKYKRALAPVYRARRRQLKEIEEDYVAIATYSNDFTTNIGDAIQENAIYDAIKTVLPDVKVTKVLRDSWQDSHSRALNVMQGWFGRKQSIPNGRNLWIATHFAGDLRESMKNNPPKGDFGARDPLTGMIVPDGYLSRCYTLAMPRRESTPKRGRVFLTNIPPEWEVFIPKELVQDCVRVTHHYEGPDMSAAAREMIARYRDEADLVVTCKVHCASPCTALGIPVVAISDSHEGAGRMGFLEGIINIWSIQELRDGKIDWNPVAPDIEKLKTLMLENLRISILTAQGNPSGHTELEGIRRRIGEFRV